MRSITPGDGEEENQDLKGRQSYVKKPMFWRPIRGFSFSSTVILGLRAAPQRFTPGYCSCRASGTASADC